MDPSSSGASLSSAGAEDEGAGAASHHFSYLRRRPMHPERFFSFARRYFGPLDQDLPPNDPCLPPSAPLGAAAVLSASGCVWFLGSDDMRAEWKFEAGSGESRVRRHLIRCGDPWADAGREDQPGAGDRRVELRVTYELDHESHESDAGTAVEVWERELLAALTACLITRDEAASLEAGHCELLSGPCEWEELRATHESLAPWVAQWRPLLGLLHGLTTFVSFLPGFSRLSSFGRAFSTWLIGCG
eukprot:gb/GFBE01043912.1/.p1 GENE.gb/GFBE01043912.1/~~gb/GFBE01043912.1/.p1  ORF type:complete len:245 (+),score=30.96 gb/GFBE01043912.1/:1-735(+)